MGLFLLSSTLECRCKLKEVLDIMKEQAEILHAELDNNPLVASALGSMRVEPDIEKKIAIETDNQYILVQTE